MKNYIALALPHSIVEVSDFEEHAEKGDSNSSLCFLPFRRDTLSWEIPYASLEEKGLIAKGSIGDYIRCMWKGMEVSKFIASRIDLT